MAGAINGLGAQQLAGSLQPASQARDANQEIQERDESNADIEQGEVAREAQGAAVNETQESETEGQQSEFERQIQQVEAAGQTEETERGSLVDVLV